MQNIVILDKPERKDYEINLDNVGQKSEVYVAVMAIISGTYGLKLTVNHKSSETSGKVIIRAIAKSRAIIEIDSLIKAGPVNNVNDVIDARVLLLSKHSQVKVEPKLEVETDQAQINHAVTISQLDEEQMLYLTSRGLAREAAEKLLIQGFFKPMFKLIKDKRTLEIVNQITS